MSNEINEFERPSPHDVNAEQIVLGAMMMSPSAIDDAAGMLAASDFYRPAHQHIYSAILDLYGRSEPTDPVAVSTQLDKDDKLTVTGGLPYLFTLYQSAPVAESAGYYSKVVLEHSVRRKVEAAGHRIVQLSRSAGLGIEELVASAASVLEENTARTTAEDSDTLASTLPAWLDRLEDKTPDEVVSTGFADLDNLLGGGLRPGQLTIVAGRPGMGKTVLMANIATHVGVTLGLPALFASLEMPRQELVDRIVADYAKVSLHALRSKELNDNDWTSIAKALSALGEADKFILDDQPGTGLTRIRSRLRAMQRSGNPCRLLVVDYLQLMTSEGRTESRQLEISQLSRSLKLLAKEFSVPVVVGSQLNREVERRSDKKPGLSDLRESGSLEQDADIVILLHREDAYDKESPRAGEADFLVAKHRNGPTATITVAFQGHYSRFRDMSPEPTHPQLASR